MSHLLPSVAAHVRQQNRPNSHGAILLAEIDRLHAAIQAHHDTKHGTVYLAAVLAPPDRDLYDAAGVAHRVLETTEGSDAQRLRAGVVARSALA